AFVISTPLTVMSAIASAARKGILFKGGAVVEDLHKVKWIALDKTGTITRGKPRLKEIRVLCGCHTEDEILTIAASLESNITHPIAEAITSSARGKNLKTLDFKDVSYKLGYGVSGRLNENIWEVVSARERKESGIVLSVKKDGIDEAVLILEDELKEGAKESIQRLKEMGYRVIIISGDRRGNVESIAKAVGVNEFIAEASPEDKLRKIEELSKSGGCCMVGDGINDGPALAAATFGIAMGTLASDVALDTSDVNILSDNINLLPKAFEISKKSYGIILQNIVISLGSVVLMILLNLFGVINILVGVIGHEGTTVLVALNGLRALFLK
ncbi:MAG: HAD-IC family P-type ATPase, partial [candidate division WOR-3 bacterium]